MRLESIEYPFEVVLLFLAFFHQLVEITLIEPIPDPTEPSGISG